MKNIVLSSVVAALIVLSGCSDKELVVEDKNRVFQEQVQEVEAVKTEVVSAESSLINSSSASSYSSSSSMSLDDIEAKIPSVYFGFDKFDITDESQSDISTGVSIANNTGSAFNVKLEGNCDEWGSDEYNFALGLKRASSVKNALVAEGIDESRISMVSFGESNPTCSSSTKDCWSKNRRVDFKLLP